MDTARTAVGSLACILSACAAALLIVISCARTPRSAPTPADDAKTAPAPEPPPVAVAPAEPNEEPVVAVTEEPSAAEDAAATVEPAEPEKPKDEWIQLFNGKNLDGWHVKIKGHDLDDNYGDTFRVEDGILKVSYDKYDKWGGRFGHLFYHKPFSNYIMRVEYRFAGDQIAGGPGWAFRNSGIMIHGQPADTMRKDQNFPASIEVQLLGGKGTGTRATLNLCTPGTHVVMDGTLITRHVINSTAPTYHGDQWVTVEVEVRGHEVIKHKIDGKTVLSYNEPQLDPKDGDARRLIAAGADVKLSGGSISLQSESHPVEFRKVELKVLTE